jgi:hypothetical protein
VLAQQPAFFQIDHRILPFCSKAGGLNAWVSVVMIAQFAMESVSVGAYQSRATGIFLRRFNRSPMG